MAGALVRPEEYDRWYRTGKGRGIGDAEFRLLRWALRPLPGERLLDLGCGSGYFTRRFAELGLGLVVGVDADRERVRYAASRAAARERFVVGAIEALPFRDHSFEITVSVTAFCFVREEARALAEMLRVTGRRFGLGLLNRRSLLYRSKGRSGGVGGYRGARWHTSRELRELFQGRRVHAFRVSTAVAVPAGPSWLRVVERVVPSWLPWWSFLVASGDVEITPAGGGGGGSGEQLPLGA